MDTNRVTGPYTAIVNGKETGFAGCASAKDCPKASHCLRSSLDLRYRAHHRQSGSDCQYMIPLAQQANAEPGTFRASCASAKSAGDLICE